jgi:hypothetical protein
MALFATGSLGKVFLHFSRSVLYFQANAKVAEFADSPRRSLALDHVMEVQIRVLSFYSRSAIAI